MGLAQIPLNTPFKDFSDQRMEAVTISNRIVTIPSIKHGYVNQHT